ncbi:MAG: translation initiation factor Sui1 [Halioglobus sp.]|nr:translation initiation factor Sui1 [Halioglobus sp.]
MSQRRPANSRLVYSTESGRFCPGCQRTLGKCVCQAGPPASGGGDGIVRLHRQSKGRGGKPVTLISGLALNEQALKTLASELKKKCGVGGSVKGNDIEIQGDSREKLKQELERRGYQVKIAGG